MKRLLVLDDDPEVSELFHLFLRKRFDAVLIAASVAEAEALLAAEPITHLVSDCALKPGEPSPLERVSGWRAACPTLGYVALFTGATELSPVALPPGADALFVKPDGFDALLERLLAGI